jgi:hypothetical protein
VWLAPDELAKLLEDRVPIDQFRDHAQALAQRGFDELQTGAYVAEQKYAMEASRTFADISFDVIALVLDFVPLPFKTIGSIAARRGLAERKSRPYRWLLNTTEIDAKAK